MRKFVLVVGLMCLSASVALAQGKVSNGWACGKPAPAQSIDVGDQANHAYSLAQIKCTSTKGEIAGVREKEGTGTEFAEVKGNASSGHGVFVETMANGDTINFSYKTSAAIKNGQLQSGTNKWQATGGTGKFKGITGIGTCKGTGNPDGSTTWTCAGTYSIPK
jgi:hypothetical protein